MQNPTLQMGVEVEMHGLSFTFKRSDPGHPNTFWPQPPAGTDADTTMIAHQPILVPESFANTQPAQTISTLAWGGNWGFIVCGDAFGSDHPTTLHGAVSCPHTRCTALEINTAAHEIRDALYWVKSRLAVQLFREALQELSFAAPGLPGTGTTFFQAHEPWFPIDELVTAYNAKIDTEWVANGWGVLGGAALQEFRLKKSFHLDRFEVQPLPGNHLGVAGNWRAWFTIRRTTSGGPLGYYVDCDAQVNYQVDLEYLWEHTDEWIEMWAHIWMDHVQTAALSGIFMSPDPSSGHHTPAAATIVYRNQINAALWRMGKAGADLVIQSLGTIPYIGLATLSPQSYVQVKALFMLLIANGAIEPGPAGAGGTNKNAYSQFSKSSPASIAAEIGTSVMQKAAVRRIADLTTYVSIGGQAVWDYVHNYVANHRGGNVNNLRPFLPTGGPYKDKGPTYRTNLTDVIVTANLDVNRFRKLWKGTFRNAVLNAGNKFGYDTAGPFHCYWALAHTPKEAIKDPTSGRIKILFESRYGHNRLNLGFHPGSAEAVFYEAYKSLLMLTVPTTAERSNTLTIAKATSSSRGRAKFRRQMKKGQKKGVH